MVTRRTLALIGLAIGAAVPSVASAAAPPTGTLNHLGCIEVSGGPDECSATGIGIDEPTTILAAPGSTSLYSGSEGDNALTPLARAPTGASGPSPRSKRRRAPSAQARPPA